MPKNIQAEIQGANLLLLSLLDEKTAGGKFHLQMVQKGKQKKSKKSLVLLEKLREQLQMEQGRMGKTTSITTVENRPCVPGTPCYAVPTIHYPCGHRASSDGKPLSQGGAESQVKLGFCLFTL
jgi:hypothetical protein